MGALSSGDLAGQESAASARPAAAPLPELTSALGLFLDLGLPSTRGAKWVKAELFDGAQGKDLPQPQNAQYSGNAWLVREGKDGTVDLILNQSRRVQARRRNEGEMVAPTTPGGLPTVSIAAADLEQDIQLLGTVLGGKDAQPDLESEFESARFTESAGTTLLFIAHLQTQGRRAAVATLLPRLLTLPTPPAQLIDAALDDLANEQCASLSEEWVKTGNTKVYLAGLRQLLAVFTRGWNGRQSVELVIARMEAGSPGPFSGKPEALKTATFLLKLTAAQAESLPLNYNWLHPGKLNSRFSPFGGSEDFAERDDAESGNNPSEEIFDGNRSGAREKDAVASFFSSHPRERAAGLAQLLGDHRFLRVMRKDVSRNYFSDGEDSAQEKLENVYRSLSRPFELGELAGQLLAAVLPSDFRAEEGEAKNSAIREWIKEIVAMDDEQLSWEYLRRGSAGYDPLVGGSIAYLVEKGGAESLRQLREVFLDPAIWKFSQFESFLPSLQVYLKRAEADPSFEAKVTAVVRDSVRLGDREPESREGGEAGQFEERLADWRKRKALEEAEKLKALAQALHPRGLDQLLEDLNANSEQPPSSLLRLLRPELAKDPQAEAKLYRCAAKISDLSTKRALLQALLQMGPPGKTASPRATFAGDPETKRALTVLLADRRSDNEEGGWGGVQTIAELTATVLLSRGIPEGQSARWRQIAEVDRDLLQSFSALSAQALINDQPLPDFPDAGSVAPLQVARLIEELSALPSAEIGPALQGKSLSEQLALTVHLNGLAQWPASLATLRRSIEKVQGAAVEAIHGERWKGRPLNAELLQEIEDELMAGEGKGILEVSLQRGGGLHGLALTIMVPQIPPEFSGISLDQLAPMLLPAKIPVDTQPTAAVFFHAQGGTGQREAYPRPKVSLVWADQAKTKAWRETVAKSASNLPDEAAPKLPAEVVKKLTADPRAAFTLRWGVVPVKAP